MSDHEFEKQVRQKLNELRLAPSAGAWEHIEEGLRERKRRRAVWIWLPVLLLGLGVGGWMFLDDNRQTTIDNDKTEVGRRETGNGKRETSSVKRETSDVKRETLPDKQQPLIVKRDNNKHEPVTITEYRVQNPDSRLPISDSRLTSDVSRLPIADSRLSDKHSPLTIDHSPTATADSRLPISDSRLTSDVSRLPISDSRLTSDVSRLPNAESRLSDKHSPLTIDHSPVATADSRLPISNSRLTFDVSRLPISDSRLTFDVSRFTFLRPPSIFHVSRLTFAEPQLIKLPPTRKWSFGVTGFAGISAVNEGNFLNFSKPEVADVAYRASFQQPAFAPTFTPSRISPGFSFSGGAFAQRTINRKFSITGGINYMQLNTQNKVGHEVIGSQIVNNGTSGYLSVYNYFTLDRDRSKEYKNKYHFIEIPVSLNTRLNPRSKKPLYWNAGIAVSRLIKSNSLHFDGTTGVYYKNDELINKTQLAVTTGFNISILNKRSTPVWIGPSVKYNVSKILQKELSANKNFMSLGVDVKIFLK